MDGIDERNYPDQFDVTNRYLPVTGEEEQPDGTTIITNRPELMGKEGYEYRYMGEPAKLATGGAPPGPRPGTAIESPYVTAEDKELIEHRQGFRKYVLDTHFGGQDPDQIDPRKDALVAHKAFIEAVKKKYGDTVSDPKLFNVIKDQGNRIYKDTYEARKQQKDVMIKHLDHATQEFDTALRQKRSSMLTTERQKEMSTWKPTHKAYDAKTLNDYLYNITGKDKNTLPTQEDYNSLQTMAYQSGYDVKWVNQGDEKNPKWRPNLQKQDKGFHGDDLFFDESGWRHKGADGKWYYGRPEWYDKSGRYLMESKGGVMGVHEPEQPGSKPDPLGIRVSPLGPQSRRSRETGDIIEAEYIPEEGPDLNA